MKCPICQSPLQFKSNGSRCENDHTFGMKNGVHQINTPDYQKKLDAFLSAFEDSRKNEIGKYTPEILQRLPEAEFDTGMWSLRKMDLQLIQKYVSKGGAALELGAWNSWLTQHLAKTGMKTTAIDLFVHEIDGLGAKQHYSENWMAIQMDLQRLEIIDEKFDVIVVNRSLPYFKDLPRTIDMLKALLKVGGTLVITGITYQKNPQRIQDQLDTAKHTFEARYNTPFMLHDFKGYFTNSDLQYLKSKNVQLKLYPELKLKSYAAKLISSRPRYYYGIFMKES